MSPLSSRPESSKHLSYKLGCLYIDYRNPLHLSETNLFLRANDFQANPETQIIIELMRDTGLIVAELEHWKGI